MGKGTFLLGLLAGGAAAYVAYQALDDDQQDELKNKVSDKLGDARDRAIDYTFYAMDALEDLKDHVSDHSADWKSTTMDYANQFGATAGDAVNKIQAGVNNVMPGSSDEEDEGDDIILSSDEAFAEPEPDEKAVEQDDHPDDMDAKPDNSKK